MAFRQRTSGRKKKKKKRKSKVVLSRNPQRFEAVEKESKTEQASEPAMGVGYKMKKHSKEELAANSAAAADIQL